MPFNDLEAAQQVFAERGEEIAGMIIEPIMTNCGVVLPDPGYLDGLKEVCHTHGALFAFDEVKTGFTVAWGGAIEAFGVQPDLVAFAKALGAGLPCGAIGGTEEAMAGVIAGDDRAGRHVQRQPADDGRRQGQPRGGPHEGRLRAAGRDRRDPAPAART